MTSNPAPAVSATRKWWSLGYAGFIASISGWSFVAAIVALDPEGDAEYSAAPWLLLAVGLAPVALAALAWATKRRRAVRAVGIGTVLVLVVGYVTLLAARDPITGAAAGYAAGAAVALPPEPGHGRRPRTIAVVATALYVFIMARTALVFALAFALMMAVLSVGVADMLMERHLERQAQRRKRR